ncbi:MAG: hypothetical protein EBU46_07495 [Nitrosomonadaceae bacterium]|nr:hypothetical protein [Nitrosomonadaceae bacterium]
MKIYFPLRFAVTCFALIVVTGCSSFSGAKLGDDAGSKVIGIPYTLVRPEYTLTRTPPPEGQKKAIYIVGVTYEPDPQHRYTLSINPGIFADPTFLMKFGTGGVLQGTTASVAETLTPTITAIGSFGANLIGTMATGVFDKDSVRKVIITAISKSRTCGIKPPDIDLLDTGDVLPTTVGDAMIERIDAFKDDTEFAELFHYATNKEKNCLIEANTSIKMLITDQHDTVLNNWKEALARYQQDFPGDKLFIDRLKDAVSTDDNKQLEVIKTEIADDGASNDADKQKTARNRDGIYSLAAGAAQASMSNEAQEKLTFFIEMDASTWRARHLQYLEREIDRSTLVALRRPTLDRTKAKQFVDRMRLQRAMTIDAVALFRRALELERFLQQVPNKSVDGGGMAPAAAEYATVRAELDTVLTQMDARRTRVIADAKPAPPPPVTPLKVENLPVATKKLIDESKAPGWIKGPGADAPNYVMILKGVE